MVVLVPPGRRQGLGVRHPPYYSDAAPPSSSPWVGPALGTLGLVGALATALVSTTLRSIMIIACYRYAATGEAPGEFDGQTLQAMLKAK